MKPYQIQVSNPRQAMVLDPEEYLDETEPGQSNGAIRLAQAILPRGLVILAILIALWLLNGAPNPFTSSEQTASGSAVWLGVTSSGPAPRPGKPAPMFQGTTLDGEELGLPDLSGKVVLVNFFATWCGPCRAEMPDLDSLATEYKDRGLVVVAVNLQEDPNKVRSYVELLGLNFPILLDPTGEITSRYAVTALPSTFFIGKDGVLRDINVGPLSKNGFANKVNGLLEES